MNTAKPLYHGYRYPAEIISHAVWLYFRFTLSHLLKGLCYVPRVLVTDKLRSYVAARKERIPGVEHRPHQGLNNRAELSHPPTHPPTRTADAPFKSPGHAQRFLSAHGPINNLFRPRRHRLAATD